VGGGGELDHAPASLPLAHHLDKRKIRLRTEALNHYVPKLFMCPFVAYILEQKSTIANRKQTHHKVQESQTGGGKTAPTVFH
jgi:hypothetical protein